MSRITDAEKGCFAETALVFRRGGFQVKWPENRRLSVALDDRLICEAGAAGGMKRLEESVETTEHVNK